MHVYVVHSGAKERKLGVVESFTKGDFALQRSDYAEGTLQLFVISPLDGNHLLTDAVPVTDGTFIRLDLNHSGGFLWPRRAALDRLRLQRS